MKMNKVYLGLATLLLTSTLLAEESSVATEEKAVVKTTRTIISFHLDEDGNLNPNIFIPIYYGPSQHFFSAIGFTSTNEQSVDVLDSFKDSKNSFVSDSKDLAIHYISYANTLFGFPVSIGINSTFSKVNNNEFGYIHDSDNIFGKGSDYYISFDNTIKLNIQKHAINADIKIPMGHYFASRISTIIAPYTTIKVEQSTIFKPLVTETGSSNSTTSQDLAYTFRYDGQINTGTFFNLGFTAYYDNQPLKYDIAQLSTKNNNFIFETNKVDSTEVTTRFIARVLFDIDVLGGLSPSLGYGIESLNRKNNLTGESVKTDKTIFTLGFEKLF